MEKSKLKGVNGYSGEILKAWFAPLTEVNGVSFTPDGSITRTNSIPIWLQFTDNTGLPLYDIVGEILVLSFAPELQDLTVPQLLLEVEIPPIAPTIDAVFSGTITDDQTFTLPLGRIYVSLKHIKANGVTKILDMCQTVVNSSVSQRRA